MLAAKAAAAHARNRRVCGSPRVWAALVASGEAVSENTVATVTRSRQLRAKTGRKFVPRTTDARHGSPVAANVLNRESAADPPDRKRAADITYVPTGPGWLHPAGAIDLCSPKLVGRSMADHMGTDLVTDALRTALAQRPPGRGLLHHSDRGVRYASDDDRKLLADRGLACGMSGKGERGDNAVVESFRGTLEAELVGHERYATRDEARASIFRVRGGVLQPQTAAQFVRLRQPRSVRGGPKLITTRAHRSWGRSNIVLCLDPVIPGILPGARSVGIG